MALSRDKIDLMIALVKKGDMSNRAIALEVGCGNKAVGQIIRRNNIDTNGAIYKNIKRRESNIYIIRAGNTHYYKIGVANDTGERLKSLQTSHYEKLKVIRFFFSEDAYELEKRLHQKYTDKGQHIRGEWFSLKDFDISDIEDFVYGF